MGAAGLGRAWRCRTLIAPGLSKTKVRLLLCGRQLVHHPYFLRAKALAGIGWPCLGRLVKVAAHLPTYPLRDGPRHLAHVFLVVYEQM